MTLLTSEHSYASSIAILVESFLFTVISKVIYKQKSVISKAVISNVAFINVISKVFISIVVVSGALPLCYHCQPLCHSFLSKNLWKKIGIENELKNWKSQMLDWAKWAKYS